ncbi:alanine--tRNA ligase [Litorivivens sp.]|uniref:alanine--tRNA ligase n=1 Tax=Litorivivens sp. TaxID=2020868 RepID=UPI003563962B
MKSAEIRDAFLKYFESKGHAPVDSSSLVPGNDPTLLFTNAGMVQFKDVFLGDDQRPYTRATSSQRCVRAGGKHNDLENVGYTARHHTFFEMLGNFSFGDYFKREAIQFAWELLTKEFKLPPEKLWVTVHVSDDEAADIWLKELGVSAERFSRLDEDNFWQMGDTGPCGPSSEIFYDHGPDVPGGPPGSPDDDGDRYIEIWNLVFMQFNRDASGELSPLPNPSIDTGMGLERIAAVMQGVHSNYEIDLFQNLIGAAAEVTGTSDLENKSLRVIADHIRSCAFLISDGVMPSNEGRGYVLRRIIRRAARHGNKLGATDAFFHKLVGPLAKEMGGAYPELIKGQARIEKALLNEEEQFAKTLDQGMRILEQDLEGLAGSVIPGETVFRLYDTYGFPVDLTADIAREKDLTLDMEGFEACMQQQRERARAASSFKMASGEKLELDGQTEFCGYSSLVGDARVVALFKDGAAVSSLAEGESGVVVLDKTPFYAESGGQAGDAGLITAATSRFEVLDTQKNGDHHLHHGSLVSGALKVNDAVTAEVKADIRQATALNHSATHLLHAALRTVLGDHVAQKGSLVNAERLRFDFSHPESVSAEELQTIEAMVNAQIRRNTAVETQVTDIESAKQAGAMMLFGEKYGDEVRVLSMGDGFSVELCGGTHVDRTGDIGLFRISAEYGVASGVRRIEAVTGEGALQEVSADRKRLGAAMATLKATPENFDSKLGQLVSSNRELQKEIDRLKAKLATAGSRDLTAEAVEVNGVKVLAVKIEGADAKSLRDSMDQLKNKLQSGVLLLAAVEGDKVALAAGVTKDLTGRFKAGDLMRQAAAAVGGKGGGRPDMAQGGGDQPANVEKALAVAAEYVKNL